MSQSEETKRKLLEAAWSVFTEKGYYKAKVADISAEAGVAKGTFYLYFDSKIGCFNQLWACFTKAFGEELDREYAELDTNSIYKIPETIQNSIKKHRELMTIAHFEQEHLSDEVVELYKRVPTKIKGIFREALRKRGESEKMVVMKTNMVFGMVNKYMLDRIYILNPKMEFDDDFPIDTIKFIIDEV